MTQTEKLKECGFKTLFPDTTVDDYLTNPDYLLREALIRTILDEMQMGGIDTIFINKMYGFSNLLDNFETICDVLQKIKDEEDKESK